MNCKALGRLVDPILVDPVLGQSTQSARKTINMFISTANNWQTHCQESKLESSKMTAKMPANKMLHFADNRV